MGEEVSASEKFFFREAFSEIVTRGRLAGSLSLFRLERLPANRPDVLD